MSAKEPILSVRDLTVSFATDGGVLRALDSVSFDVPKGHAVALVGESGCGKSVTAQAIMRLIPSPPGRIDAGVIQLEGRNLLGLSEREMQTVRGGRIGIVFQEPMTALNPVYTIGWQIAEAIRLHRSVSRAEARRLSIEGLKRVGFPEPATHIDRYPHELSGGMRQRVLIAMALACDPVLLIADEPTTALDATIQAQILELLQKLRGELEMSLLLIAHDLAVVAEIADEIVVLYAGVMVERGPARAILREPEHPYTRALLRSIPPTDASAYRVHGQKRPKLPTIDGSLPDLRSPPLGCRFQTRCGDAMARCSIDAPRLFKTRYGEARCFLVEPSTPDDEPNRGAS